MSATITIQIGNQGSQEIPLTVGDDIKAILEPFGIDVESVTAKLNGAIVSGSAVPEPGDQVRTMGNIKAG